MLTDSKDSFDEILGLTGIEYVSNYLNRCLNSLYITSNVISCYYALSYIRSATKLITNELNRFSLQSNRIVKKFKSQYNIITGLKSKYKWQDEHKPSDFEERYNDPRIRAKSSFVGGLEKKSNENNNINISIPALVDSRRAGEEAGEEWIPQLSRENLYGNDGLYSNIQKRKMHRGNKFLEKKHTLVFSSRFKANESKFTYGYVYRFVAESIDSYFKPDKNMLARLVAYSELNMNGLTIDLSPPITSWYLLGTFTTPDSNEYSENSPELIVLKLCTKKFSNAMRSLLRALSVSNILISILEKKQGYLDYIFEKSIMDKSIIDTADILKHTELNPQGMFGSKHTDVEAEINQVAMYTKYGYEKLYLYYVLAVSVSLQGISWINRIYQSNKTLRSSYYLLFKHLEKSCYTDMREYSTMFSDDITENVTDLKNFERFYIFLINFIKRLEDKVLNFDKLCDDATYFNSVLPVKDLISKKLSIVREQLKNINMIRQLRSKRHNVFTVGSAKYSGKFADFFLKEEVEYPNMFGNISPEDFKYVWSRLADSAGLLNLLEKIDNFTSRELRIETQILRIWLVLISVAGKLSVLILLCNKVNAEKTLASGKKSKLNLGSKMFGNGKNTAKNASLTSYRKKSTQKELFQYDIKNRSVGEDIKLNISHLELNKDRKASEMSTWSQSEYMMQIPQNSRRKYNMNADSLNETRKMGDYTLKSNEINNLSSRGTIKVDTAGYKPDGGSHTLSIKSLVANTGQRSPINTFKRLSESEGRVEEKEYPVVSDFEIKDKSDNKFLDPKSEYFVKDTKFISTRTVDRLKLIRENSPFNNLDDNMIGILKFSRKVCILAEHMFAYSVNKSFDAWYHDYACSFDTSALAEIVFKDGRISSSENDTDLNIEFMHKNLKHTSRRTTKKSQNLDWPFEVKARQEMIYRFISLGLKNVGTIILDLSYAKKDPLGCQEDSVHSHIREELISFRLKRFMAQAAILKAYDELLLQSTIETHLPSTLHLLSYSGNQVEQIGSEEIKCAYNLASSTLEHFKDSWLDMEISRMYYNVTGTKIRGSSESNTERKKTETEKAVEGVVSSMAIGATEHLLQGVLVQLNATLKFEL